MRRVVTSLVLLVLATTPLLGQEGWRLDIAPKAALVLPGEELGPFARLSDGNYLRLERPGAALGYGATALLRRAGSAWSVRGAFLRSFATGVGGTWDCVGGLDPEPGAACRFLILTSVRSEATLTAGSLGFLRELPALLDDRLRPFAGAGVGATRTSVSWPEVTGRFQGGSASQSHFAIDLSAGAEWTWGAVSLLAEAEDWIRIGGGSGTDARARPGDAPPVAPRDDRDGVRHRLAFSLGAKLRAF